MISEVSLLLGIVTVVTKVELLFVSVRRLVLVFNVGHSKSVS